MNTQHFVQSAFPTDTSARAALKRLAGALCFPVLALSGCYVIPVGPDGTPHYTVAVPAAPLPGAVPGTPFPAVLNARLYPANDLANQTGMLTGTVTNLMTGRGRFQFNYQGELLSGEATRVAGDERRGVASAYGARGTYVSCEYQMNSPYQGAGTCTFSNGARYQVHLGS